MEEKDKWTLALLAALLFLIVSSGVFFGLFNTLFTSIGLPRTMTSKGPTIFGSLVMSLIYLLLIRYLVLS